jgi:hypothetical protein
MRLMLAAVASMLSPRYAFAASELRTLVIDDTPASRRAVEALKRRFPQMVIGDEIGALSRRAGPAVYLAVGPAALKAATASGVQAPLLSLFTARQAFHQIVNAAAPPRRGTTAIYAEASPVHQLRLVSSIFQRRVTVGVLLTDGSAHLEPLLDRAARDMDVVIQTHRTTPNTNMVRELNRLADTDVILAMPDVGIFSADNFRDILESTYRRGQPIVCFSQGMVAAGCLAAAYAPVDDVVAQAADLLTELEAGRLPAPRYPAYWRVAVNYNVARSLNIVISDSVRALGERPPGSR